MIKNVNNNWLKKNPNEIYILCFPLISLIYLLGLAWERNPTEIKKKTSSYNLISNKLGINFLLISLNDDKINKEINIMTKEDKLVNIDLNKTQTSIYNIISKLNYKLDWYNIIENINIFKYWVINNWKSTKYTIVSMLFAILFFNSISESIYDYIKEILEYILIIFIDLYNYLLLDDITLNADMLSWVFIWLNGFIFPLSYLSNWVNIMDLKLYYIIIMILLEWLLTIVFLVTDIILFYVTFESTLPLLFFLIGLFGASQKIRAGFYIFLYTLFGSLFMLLSFVKIYGETGSTSYQTLSTNYYSNILQIWLWIPLFISFSIKTPLVPFHIWLPLAHSDANVSGSIILASVVLKLALYGFLRILIGILHYSTKFLFPFVIGICVLSIIYSSISTIRQFDVKVLVAYSSIAHMGSTILGAFSDTIYGIIGSILFGLAHGFVSPALFILVGAILYDRCGSRTINYYRGLVNITPLFSLLFLIFLFGNMGVPLTANFLGELISLLAAFQSSFILVGIATLSVVFSAVYSILLFNRITSNSISNYIITIPDLFRRELFILLPLVLLTILFGVYPSLFTNPLEFSLSSSMYFLATTIKFSKNNEIIGYSNLFKSQQVDLNYNLIECDQNSIFIAKEGYNIIKNYNNYEFTNEDNNIIYNKEILETLDEQNIISINNSFLDTILNLFLVITKKINNIILHDLDSKFTEFLYNFKNYINTDFLFSVLYNISYISIIIFVLMFTIIVSIILAYILKCIFLNISNKTIYSIRNNESNHYIENKQKKLNISYSNDESDIQIYYQDNKPKEEGEENMKSEKDDKESEKEDKDKKSNDKDSKSNESEGTKTKNKRGRKPKGKNPKQEPKKEDQRDQSPTRNDKYRGGNMDSFTGYKREVMERFINDQHETANKRPRVN